MALLVLSASSCASWMGGPKAITSSWMGSELDDLERAWGNYTKKGRLSDGTPTYTWVLERTIPDGAGGFVERECSITMIIDGQGHFAAANWTGSCIGIGLPKGPN